MEKNINASNINQTAGNIKKVSSADLSRFLLDTRKIFARETFAKQEIKKGRARMFGIFSGGKGFEDLYILERI